MANETLTYQLSAAQSLAIAFGRSAVPLLYKIDKDQQANPTLNYNIDSEVSAEAFIQSHLGTPIMFPMTLKAGNYQEYIDGDLVEIEMADFRMPLTTMVDFKRAKLMTTTKLSSGNGTIKEMYGFDDWQIYIRGLILKEPGHPQIEDVVEQKKMLKRWENLADSIEVEGALFSDLDIFNLVIKDITFGQIEGSPNVVAFTITAVSDEPIELI